MKSLASTPAVQEANILTEVEDSLLRLKNVIIFVAEESNNPVQSVRDSEDLEKVKNICSSLKVPVTDCKCHRIGEYSSVLIKPRPLKVILSNSSSVDQLINEIRKTKRGTAQDTILHKISIIKDRTVRQRADHKAIKAELESCQAEGETDLRIVMRKGCYSIVKNQHSVPRVNISLH